MDLISLNEASRYLCCSPHTVRKWVDAGHIKAKVYPNGRFILKRADVVAFWDSLPDRADRAILASRADQKTLS